MTNPMYALNHQPVPPLVAKVLQQLATEIDGHDKGWQDVRWLHTMHETFKRLHAFGMAKKFDVLVDGSGEELACQFMPYYNLYEPGTY